MGGVTAACTGSAASVYTTLASGGEEKATALLDMFHIG
jgi:hypothetical protein